MFPCRRQLESNLPPRRFGRNHELPDRVDKFLNFTVVGIQSVFQFINLGGEFLIASISRKRTKARTTNTLIVMACCELSTVAAMIAPCSVNAKGG